MTPAQNADQPLRVWPGVIAVILQWTLWLGAVYLVPDYYMSGLLGGIAGGAVAVLVWWLAFSRAPHIERWAGLVVILAAWFATRTILDKSIVGGMMGMMFIMFAIPTVCLALVIGAVISRRMPAVPRRVTLAVAILLGCAVWGVARTEGITGEGKMQLAWRWKATPEQKLLTAPEPPPVVAVAASPVEAPKTIPVSLSTTPAVAVRPPILTAEWPGFRGPHRDDVVTGTRIRTDWTAAPPAQMWRHAVGPGWSSFAVGGGLIFTQEQRGESEVVASYDLATGKPVWVHRDAARFYESNGGAGPRGTPALDQGRIFSLGATGILNALDAATGQVIWSHNAATDTKTKMPGWAFAGSPLVVGDLVMVAVSGKLAAYEAASGKLRWQGPKADASYSSPHFAKLGGVEQVMLISGDGVASFAPADGKLLWKHDWPGAAMLQPTITEDGAVLITSGDMGGGMGTRKLDLTKTADAWSAKEAWTSSGLKPYFNDIAVHNGHAYGFDGAILACIDLADGKRKWKGGHYGHGQLLLLADQDALLVLSEEGELALVSATPDRFNEIARVPVLEGKTWNHLVLVGDVLLVRNDREMAAFRLASPGV